MVKIKIENESNRERFKRLAVIRTKKVIEKLRVLGHCANRTLYEYNEEDVKKIFSTLEKELNTTRSKFKESKKYEFSL